MKELIDHLRREKTHLDELLDAVVKAEGLTDDQRPDILDALEVAKFSLTDALEVCNDSE